VLGTSQHEFCIPTIMAGSHIVKKEKKKRERKGKEGKRITTGGKEKPIVTPRRQFLRHCSLSHTGAPCASQGGGGGGKERGRGGKT